MNILNAMFLPWNAGTENAFLSYAKALSDSGFNTINLVHPKAQIITKLKENDLQFIKTKFLGKLGKYDPITICYLKYLIKKHKINLVFAHQGRLIQLFKKACTKNVKLVAVNHGHNPKHSVGTDLAITLNSNVLQTTIQLGQDINKIILLPNGIDVDKQFNKKNFHNKFTIGSYGRFSPEKGYDILIESLKIINDQNIDFIALIGGSGAEEKNLFELVRKYSLMGRVKFVGWVLDQKSFFEQIDLFVLPSRREEQGLAVLESIKHSTPVLATKNYGCLDLIKDGTNGFLTELENSSKMADKIKSIMKNKDILPQIANNAFNDLKENYSYNIFKKNLLKILSCDKKQN